MKIIDAAAHFEHAVKKSNEFHGFRLIIKIIIRRVLFEKVQHTGDCGLTGRFADNRTSLPLISSF